VETELNIPTGWRLAIIAVFAAVTATSVSLGLQHKPTSSEPNGRRASYAKYFSGPAPTPAATATPLRTIGISSMTSGLRDFAVERGRLFGLQAPPSRRLVTADIPPRGLVASNATAKALDLVDPSSIVVAEADGSPWIYDFRLGAFGSQGAAAAGANRPAVTLQPALFQPTWLGSRIVANGLFAHELLRLFTPSGKPDGTLGQSPFPKVVPDIAIHLNRNALVSNPAHTRVALAFLYVARLEIMSSDGMDRALSGPTEVKLAYRTMNDPVEGIERFLRTDDTRFAYVDVAADDDRVYALFSGRSRGEWKEAAGLGDTLDIWTWDGDFVGEWRLPKPVSCIAVDYRSHRLYAAVAEPQPNLLEFDTASFGPRGR